MVVENGSRVLRVKVRVWCKGIGKGKGKGAWRQWEVGLRIEMIRKEVMVERERVERI